MGLRHAYQTATADDPTDEISASEWNADHEIVGQVDFPMVSSPVNSAADVTSIFASKFAGRMGLGFIGPQGDAYRVQASLARTRTMIWNPLGNSTTAAGIFGMPAPVASGTATARNVATTNLFTRTRRLGYVSAATAAALAGFRVAAAQLTTGSGTVLGGGGFFVVIQFGISDAAAVAGARMFVGMQASTVLPTNVEPSTLVNCIGVGHGAADTNLKLYYGGTTAQTPIDLGANFPTNTLSADLYELALYAPSTLTGTVYYQVTRVNTGQTATGTLTGAAAVLPTSTVLLTPINAYRTNNATLLAVGLDMAYLYVETEN